MTERWRNPVRIEAIEPSPDIVLLGGRLMQEENVTLHKDSVDQIQAGHMCPNCFDPVETPYPVGPCRVCGLDSAHWNEYFERQFQGESWLGSRISLDDELEDLADRSKRKVFKPGSQILIPRGFQTGAK